MVGIIVLSSISQKCLCVCVCACVHVCEYECAYTCMCKYMCVVCVHLCVRACVCVCVCVHACVCAYVCIVYIRIRMYVALVRLSYLLSIYIYTCIYVQAHTYVSYLNDTIKFVKYV